MKAKKLKDIMPGNADVKIYGDIDITVNGLSIDSRKVGIGFVYAALRGTLTDGHQYITKAIEFGANCIICESLPDRQKDITYIVTNDVRGIIGEMADRYYDKPSSRMKVVGITGTNGKTTISTLLYQLFFAFGYKCGLISTVENRIGEIAIASTHTTPDVINLQALLAEMRDAGCELVFMEVSSHAIDQDRIAGIRFKGALFTNITHDHLDYHKNMKNYIRAKKKFFDGLSESAFAITNADDKNGKIMLQNTKAKKITYGLKTMADYKGKILESTVQGLHMQINNREAYFRLIGEFNAYNLTLVYSAAVELGMGSDDVLAILSGLRGAEGRFEQIIDAETGKCGIIDYAHTPDALHNVLETIKKVKDKTSAVITVVGCGGDRDNTKRPLMAQVAVSWSDKVILTSDNPRSEDPEKILDDMEEGLSDMDKKNVIRISDRKQAIKTAVMMSKDKDIILVAGKGHENYQEIKGEKFPFNDKKILQDYFLNT